MWTLVRREIAAWQRSGHVPLLWWRDDDAQFAVPALFRLLALAHRHEVPLMLAVIPVGDLTDLGAVLSDFPLTTVAQHGVTHANARQAGDVCDEFADGADAASMASAIVLASERLGHLPNTVPVYVPPWNHVNNNLPSAVQQAGLACLSAHRRQQAQDGSIPRLDVHLDLLRWGDGPCFRGTHRVLWRMWRLLRERRRSGNWDEPLGVLTHHLVHDAAAWAFLEDFLAFTASPGAAAPCRWICGAAHLRLRPHRLATAARRQR